MESASGIFAEVAKSPELQLWDGMSASAIGHPRCVVRVAFRCRHVSHARANCATPLEVRFHTPWRSVSSEPVVRLQHQIGVRANFLVAGESVCNGKEDLRRVPVNGR